jgi:hypothetical protein
MTGRRGTRAAPATPSWLRRGAWPTSYAPASSMKPLRQRGHVAAASTQAFLEGGWTQGNLVDVMMVIGDKIISNYVHGVTKVEIDFPAAAKLAA